MTADGRQPESRSASAEAARVRRRFELLVEAGTAVFAERELPRALQRITDLARNVVDARYGALGVLGPDRESLIEFVTSGLTEEERRLIGALPTGRGLLGLVIREARPIRCDDIATHPQRHGFPPHHPPMRSFLGVPVMGRGGQVFGNLYLTDKVGADAFDAEDETIAVLFASQAAVAIENARLNDEAAGLILQVQAMQRQRELFSAMINHELRNSLTAVYGWSERAVRAKTLDASQHAANEVLDSAQLTISLLNNLLDLSRLDAGKIVPVRREFSVTTEIERVVTGLKPLAEARRIDLVLNGADAGSLDSDPTLFQQIVSNLLTNAIQHGPGDQPVVISTERDASQVRVLVADRGPGIPEPVQARIFELFERFDSESGKGAGLGLPIARRLAEVLGGTLSLESGAGRGTIFILALPSETSPA